MCYHAFVCMCVSVCVLQGLVGLLCCLVFVELLWGMMRPGGEELDGVSCQGGCDIMRLWVAAAKCFLLNSLIL